MKGNWKNILLNKRALAIALAVLAFITLYMPCVSITSSARYAINNTLSYTSSGRVDYNRMLENVTYNMKSSFGETKQATRLAKSIVNIVKKGNASVMSVRGLLSGINSAFNRAVKNALIDPYVAATAEEELRGVRYGLWGITIGWLLTLFITVMTVLGLVKRKSAVGLFQIILMVLWLAAIIIALIVGGDQLGEAVGIGAMLESILRITAWPFFGVLFSVGSFILAKKADAFGAAQSFNVNQEAIQNGIASAIRAGGKIGKAMGKAAAGAVSAASNAVASANDGWTCPSCGRKLDGGSAFCGACGTRRPAKRVCPNCGTECADNMSFCGKCGTPVPAQSAHAQQFNPQRDAYAQQQNAYAQQQNAYAQQQNAYAQQNAYGDIDQTTRSQESGTMRVFAQNVEPLPLTITQLVDGAPAQTWNVALAGAMTIGRSPACELQLTDGTVSGNHLKLERMGEDLVATDLNSSNGSAVNGQRLFTPAPLHSGDTVQVGSVVLQITF